MQILQIWNCARTNVFLNNFQSDHMNNNSDIPLDYTGYRCQIKCNIVKFIITDSLITLVCN